MSTAPAPDSTSLVSQLVEGLEPGSMVTRFVVIAEVIDAEGERGVWIERGDCAEWDYLGLLGYALGYEDARD